jgi:hypothetical protein
VISLTLVSLWSPGGSTSEESCASMIHFDCSSVGRQRWSWYYLRSTVYLDVTCRTSRSQPMFLKSRRQESACYLFCLVYYWPRWRQCFPPKRLCISTRLHGVTAQEPEVFIVTCIRTSRPTNTPCSGHRDLNCDCIDAHTWRHAIYLCVEWNYWPVPGELIERTAARVLRGGSKY